MIFSNPELDGLVRTLREQKMITIRLCSARSERSAVPVLDSGQTRNVDSCEPAWLVNRFAQRNDASNGVRLRDPE